MSNFFINEFPPSSSAAWKQKIQFVLDGADYNQTLLTKTNEGITISPFYHLDTFEKLTIPIPKEGYKICTKIAISSEETANIEALTAIEKGADGVRVFEFTNTGNAPLIITNIPTTCGCTQPVWPREPIMPGAKGEIKVGFNSTGKLNKQTKNLPIISNATNDPTITFTTNVLVKQPQ